MEILYLRDVGVHRCPNRCYLISYMQVLCTLSKQQKISTKRAVKEFVDRVQCVWWPFLCVCAGLFSQKRYIYIHMYIYIYIVYIYVYTHPFTCTHKHTFDVCAGLFSKKSPHTGRCLPTIPTFTLPPLPHYVYIYIYTYTHIYMYTYWSRFRVHIHIYMYMYVHIHIYMYMYVHIYKYCGII